MRRTMHRGSRTVLWSCVLALAVGMGSPQVWAAAEDVVGEWQITQDFQGRPMVSTLAITKNADGTLAGQWGSAPLSNVKFQDGKLTFVRTIRFGDQEFSMNYTGTLKDGKLTGTLATEQGDMPAQAVRKKVKSPVLGQWDLKFSVMDREINAKLAVSEKPDGTLECLWTEPEGQHTLSNVKFQDGKLTFLRKSKLPEIDEFQGTFEGTVKGNAITGVLKHGEMGDFPVQGNRAGAALIGKWDLTTTSEFGAMPGRMVVEGDLSGIYESFGGETPMKELKLEGDQVTFKVEMGFGDQTFPMNFKGKIDGNTLKGQMGSEMGTSEVTGKKADAAPAAGAAAAGTPGTAPSGLVGTWEMTSEGRDGTPRTNTLKIRADMTGTYTSRDTETPIKDLKVEGNQVTFKYTRSFNDQEFTQEFKGRVEGNTLKGEFVSERGSRAITGKKAN
ncbi:MAG: hypothetical protein KBE04_12955 [Phycisphaerae bacterium]|nr:hypothetical protein [Phycisphaerae bacterium]